MCLALPVPDCSLLCHGQEIVEVLTDSEQAFLGLVSVETAAGNPVCMTDIGNLR